MFLPNKMLH